MIKNNKEVGNYGEKLAKVFLEKIDYKIICQNFLCKQGEIDIIAEDEDELVFIEVKTRMNKKFGNAIDAVNTYKQKHIRNATKYYVFKNKLFNRKIRFDVIEIFIIKNKVKLRHTKNVLW